MFDATLVSLSCIDDDAQGQSLDVLWENELDAEIRSAENWARLAERGFDPPARFAAYLNTLRWNCVTSTDPRLLQSPFRAGIRLEPYQLEPLRKALKLPRRSQPGDWVGLCSVGELGRRAEATAAVPEGFSGLAGAGPGALRAADGRHETGQAGGRQEATLRSQAQVPALPRHRRGQPPACGRQVTGVAWWPPPESLR